MAYYQEADDVDAHSLVLFDVDSGERFDHSRQLDHARALTALTGSAGLMMFATSAHDATIRIWSALNQLLRVVEIDGVAETLCYMSSSAVLAFSVGSDIFQIDYKSYWPERLWGRIAFLDVDATKCAANVSGGERLDDGDRIRRTTDATRMPHRIVDRPSEFDERQAQRLRRQIGEHRELLDRSSGIVGRVSDLEASVDMDMAKEYKSLLHESAHRWLSGESWRRKVSAGHCSQQVKGVSW